MGRKKGEREKEKEFNLWSTLSFGLFLLVAPSKASEESLRKMAMENERVAVAEMCKRMCVIENTTGYVGTYEAGKLAPISTL